MERGVRRGVRGGGGAFLGGLGGAKGGFRGAGGEIGGGGGGGGEGREGGMLTVCGLRSKVAARAWPTARRTTSAFACYGDETKKMI